MLEEPLIATVQAQKLIIRNFLLLSLTLRLLDTFNLMFRELRFGTKFGWFIYIEASPPSVENDTARLVSPMVSGSSSAKCLSFYYHMRGRHIDTLNVYMKLDASKNETVIWTKKGNQGNVWLNGKVNLESVDSYTILFEGRRGTGYEV